MTVGVLAPIGQGHLESAEAHRMTEVVFGTNAWEFWRSCVETPGVGCPVLFYESWGPRAPQAAWGATLRAYRESSSGFPPRNWRRFREPIAAQEDAEDHALGPGYFSGYYLVDGLHRLDPPTPFADLRSHASGRDLARRFVPIGPILVEW
jgi:hypothetical protein